MTNNEVRVIKETYLPDMRIRLLKMNDVQAPPIGCEGTVRVVDDFGSVMVAVGHGVKFECYSWRR